MSNRDNTRRGAEFVELVKRVLEREFQIALEKEFRIQPVLSKDEHRFDLGSANPRILIECKNHTWTRGGKTPHAKLKDWIVAMQHLHLAPTDRKILAVARDRHPSNGETLRNYFLRTALGRMKPPDVAVWEFDREGNICR